MYVNKHLRDIKANRHSRNSSINNIQQNKYKGVWRWDFEVKLEKEENVLLSEKAWCLPELVRNAQSQALPQT